MIMRTLLSLIALLTFSIGQAQQDTLPSAAATEATAPPPKADLFREVINAQKTLADSATGDTSKVDTLTIRTRNYTYRILRIPEKNLRSHVSFETTVERMRRKRRSTYTYWNGIDVGINTFVTPSGRVGDGPDSGPIQLRNSASRFVSINMLEQKVEFGSHHAGLMTGLGIEFTGYKLDGTAQLMYAGDSTWSVQHDNRSYSKNKVRQIGVRVPLLFEFNTKRARLPKDEAAWIASGRPAFNSDRKGNFHISFGMIGTLYFDTMYKQRYSEGGQRYRVRDKADMNLLPYRAAATVRFGIGDWNFFAEYAITPLFHPDAAPEVSPLNVGMTLIGF